MRYMRYWVFILVFLTGCAGARPWTKQEKALLVASCAATIADMTTTIQMLDNGNWETNPIMGKHPSSSKVIITMTATEIFTIILAHYFEGFRSWILGTKTVLNTGLAIHNTRLDDAH